MNQMLAIKVIQECVSAGIRHFCFCPGNRNSPLFFALQSQSNLEVFFWYEERSAAFFALGKSRSFQEPVAVITTSGTAAGELLPAVMEAYYTNTPIVLITADRPRCYRGSGAPQAAEQVGLYGLYAEFCLDVEGTENFSLANWSKHKPVHLNICFDEPLEAFPPPIYQFSERKHIPHFHDVSKKEEVQKWLNEHHRPLCIIGTLLQKDQKAIKEFLLKLNAPTYIESTSGLREDPDLQPLRITCRENIFEISENTDYLIDGILRIGGVPTLRFWRDLEKYKGKLDLLNLSHLPFSGLSWADNVYVDLHHFLPSCLPVFVNKGVYEDWHEVDQLYQNSLVDLMKEEPHSEVSLIRRLSNSIPSNSLIYLGNSLPIREWDLGACSTYNNFSIKASRGLNGIDGQISTFLGECRKDRANWGIFGDLTSLYDFAAPWILNVFSDFCINIVIVNNYGGQIFMHKFPDPSCRNFTCPHELNFQSFAQFWSLSYECWQKIPQHVPDKGLRIIELVPDPLSTKRFWEKHKKIFKDLPLFEKNGIKR